jgi:hypothetical protein
VHQQRGQQVHWDVHAQGPTVCRHQQLHRVLPAGLAWVEEVAGDGCHAVCVGRTHEAGQGAKRFACCCALC